MTDERSGAAILIECLKRQGVEFVFGYPGGAVLPIYDELFADEDIRHILVRHEAGAAHAAVIYSMMACCKLNKINPREWLTDVLRRLPAYPVNRVVELLPHRWQKTPAGQ